MHDPLQRFDLDAEMEWLREEGFYAGGRPDNGRYGERPGAHRFLGSCCGVGDSEGQHSERGIDGD